MIVRKILHGAAGAALLAAGMFVTVSSAQAECSNRTYVGRGTGLLRATAGIAARADWRREVAEPPWTRLYALVAGAQQGHRLPQTGGRKLELRRQGPRLQQLRRARSESESGAGEADRSRPFFCRRDSIAGRLSGSYASDYRRAAFAAVLQRQ